MVVTKVCSAGGSCDFVSVVVKSTSSTAGTVALSAPVTAGTDAASNPEVVFSALSCNLRLTARALAAGAGALSGVVGRMGDPMSVDVSYLHRFICICALCTHGA